MPKKYRLLASRTRVEAYQLLGHLIIVVEGELPSPGFEVDIEQRPQHGGLASYQIVRRAKAGLWPEVVTPFRYGEMFEVEALPAEIELVHAEGADRVVVLAERPPAPYEPAETAQQGVEAPVPSGPLEHVATGFSPALSFDEAFADALQNLPSFQPGHPDQLATVRVEEIGALFGGVAGFHQMYVKVKRQIG